MTAQARMRLVVAAGVGVAAVYADALVAGLWWDDYHALRPWTWSDLGAAFSRSWDPSGEVWPVFLRPLSDAVYALGFHLFGLNAFALHLFAVVGLVLAATLLGAVVRREGAAEPVALMAAAMYAGHPAIVRAQGHWWFLQNHALATLVVLCAVLLWQARRHRPSVASWWPLWAAALVGTLVKEDLLMLAPLLAALQALRARVLGDVPGPTRGLVGLAIGLPVALFAFRWAVFGGTSGLALPGMVDLLWNVARLIGRVLFVFQREHQLITAAASLASTTLLLAGAWVLLSRGRWRRREDASATALAITGVVLFAACGAAVVPYSSSSRYHLVGLAAVVLLASSVQCLAGGGAARRGRLVRAVAIGVPLALMLLAGREALAPLRPCSDEMRLADADVLEWTPVPAALRDWLARKRVACQLGEYAPVTESIGPILWRPFRPGPWAAVALLPRHESSTTLWVRARDVTTVGSAALSIVVNGRGVLGPVPLTAEWQSIRVPLVPNTWTRLRRMHRVDVAVAPRLGADAVDVRIGPRPE